MKTKISFIVFAWLSIFCLTSCDSSEKKLKDLVSKFNATLPFQSADGSSLDSAYVDDGKVKFVYTMPELNLQLLKRSQEELNREIVIMGLAICRNTNVDKLYRLILEANYDLEVIYKGVDDSDRYCLCLSQDDVKSILSPEMQEGTKMLEIMAKRENAMCPYPIDEVTVETSCHYDGNTYTCELEIDEKQLSMDLLKLAENEVKNELISNLKSSAMLAALVKCLKSSNSFVRYEFVGNISNAKMTIEILPNEM